MENFEFENYGNSGICGVMQKYYENWFKENEYDASKSNALEDYVMTNSYRDLHMNEDDIDEYEDFFASLYDIIILSGQYYDCLELDDFDI